MAINLVYISRYRIQRGIKIYIYIYIERRTAISFKSFFSGRHYMFCVITYFSTRVIEREKETEPKTEREKRKR